MDRKVEPPPTKSSSTIEKEESQKKEHQYGYRQPRTDRESPGIDADEDRKTSTDATGGPDKPTA